MVNKYVVVDLETTGNSPKRGDKIIQFAAVVIEDGKITEQFSSLINPQQNIPAFIEELTGLNDSMVVDAPLFSEIAAKVTDILEDSYFVAHNVLFDLSFLQDELLEVGCKGFYGPVLDTVELARILYPTADSYKLGDLAKIEGLEHDRPHQADSDAYVTAELFLKLLERLTVLPLVTLRQLSKLSGGLKSDIQLLIEEIITTKQQALEYVSPQLDIVRGLAIKKSDQLRQKSEQLQPIGLAYPITETEKEELLQSTFPAYEKRIGQFVMMDTVYEALSSEKHAAIEAGTGVGKSLAYLIPAAIFSFKTNSKIIISTLSTQLQHQLITKDIPLLNNIYPNTIRSCILKGRSHYLSLAKFEKSLLEEEDNYDTLLTKMQILVWLTETDSGDVDELNLSSGGHIFWNKIKNDYDLFLNDKHWQEHDFYQKAKDAALAANLIITNHALLLADLVAETAVLPDYDFAIIDEGHHFEKAAGKHFGVSIDYLSSRLLFSQIGTLEQKQLLSRFDQLLHTHKANPKLHSFEINLLMGELIYVMDEFFKIVAIFVKSKQRQKHSSYSRVSVRIKVDEDGKEWNALLTEAERFSFLLKDVIEYFSESIATFQVMAKKFSTEQKRLLEEVATLILRLKEFREAVKAVFFSPTQSHVRWVEIDLRSIQNSTTIYAFPVNVGEYLQQHFFSKKKSVIVTSATLTVKNKFDYIVRELGISQENCIYRLIPSPFDYEKQVQLIISEDLPEINAVSQQDYVVGITEHIISIAEATKGRMLILFTAHDMLKRTYDLLRESGFLSDFAIMAQGITSGSRSRLTRNFQRFEKAILLGTSSFWEGIDIPGEALSCLIIVRLPFSPPDEPITEAKSEMIKQIGGNPFSDYSLPEAVIRFKQGFGRLIRTSSDRGVIIVFDRRIVTTKYGRAFLQSIPPVTIRKYSLNEIVKAVKSWL